MENRGYVHIYTGDGKGKTTAAFGLAVRALCAGKDVYIGQFVKSMKYGETRIEELFGRAGKGYGRVRIEQLGRGCFLGRHPDPADVQSAREGLARCTEAASGGRYGVVVLDELNIALHYGLLTVDEVSELLDRRAPATEIVITGRYAPQTLIDRADLVTEMREVRHYYSAGVLSREGIDR